MPRLVGFELDDKLTLLFQKTAFYDYLRTNLAMDVRFRPTGKILREILEPGKGHKLATLDKSKCANGLGAGCIVKTSDKKFILAKRSSEVSNAKLSLAPSVGGIVDQQKDAGGDLGAPSIFKAARKHLYEEMNIIEKQIGKIVFLGITRELERGGYPDCHFYVEVNEKSENLEKQRRKAEHKEEIKDFVWVEPGEITAYIAHSDSSPGLRGCIYLLKMAGLDKSA